MDLTLEKSPDLSSGISRTEQTPHPPTPPNPQTPPFPPSFPGGVWTDPKNTPGFCGGSRPGFFGSSLGAISGPCPSVSSGQVPRTQGWEKGSLNPLRRFPARNYSPSDRGSEWKLMNVIKIPKRGGSEGGGGAQGKEMEREPWAGLINGGEKKV